MSNQSVEILVHVDEQLSESNLAQLEDKLCQDYGIEKVTVNPRRQHLMLVDYFPENIDTMQVLEYVKNKGVHAELVGGI